MTKKSRVAIGLAALTIMTLGIGGFLAKAQIGAIMNNSPVRDRPMQRAQEDVLAAFGQIEKALRDGDGVLLAGLTARRTPAGASAAVAVGLDGGLPRIGGLHLEPVAVCVRGDQAFVVASYDSRAAGKSGSYLVRYARQDGAWKIADQATSDALPYRPAVYAYLPPDGGAFTHAGLPWRAIGYAGADGKNAAQAWKVQAIRDEAYLYLRFEAKATLPSPATPIAGADADRTRVPAPPAMLITVTMTDDRQTIVRSTFELQVGAVVGARATPDDAGKEQHGVAYSMVLHGDHHEPLFDSSPSAFNRLVEVRDRFIDVRLPLKSLGLHGRSVPEIEVRRVDAPEQTAYRVARFSP